MQKTNGAGAKSKRRYANAPRCRNADVQNCSFIHRTVGVRDAFHFPSLQLSNRQTVQPCDYLASEQRESIVIRRTRIWHDDDSHLKRDMNETHKVCTASSVVHLQHSPVHTVERCNVRSTYLHISPSALLTGHICSALQDIRRTWYHCKAGWCQP